MTPTGEATNPSPAELCRNCSAPVESAFCARCGQPRLPERLTLRELARRGVAGVVELDRGFLHTALALARRPGRTAAEYVAGRTVPYTNPAKYFLLIATALQLVAIWSGALDDFVDGLTEGLQAGSRERARSVLDGYFVALLAPGVPVLAAVQRAVWRGAGRGYAEHLVFALFLVAEQMLFWLVVVPLLGGPKGEAAVVGVLAALVASAVHYGWAAGKFLGGSAWAAAGRAAAVLLLTAVLYLAILIVTMAVLMNR